MLFKRRLWFACNPEFCNILLYSKTQDHLQIKVSVFIAFKCQGGAILEEDLKMNFEGLSWKTKSVWTFEFNHCTTRIHKLTKNVPKDCR